MSEGKEPVGEALENAARIERATLTLCTSHNLHVMGRRLELTRKRDWSVEYINWATSCLEVFQHPAMMAIPITNRDRVRGARFFADRCFKRCESPLEDIFLMEVIGIDPDFDFLDVYQGDHKTSVGCWRKSGIDVHQQVQIGPHRVDFVFDAPNGRRPHVVELDGHAYHSSREALQRDKSRDRDLQARGYSVLRFTYDEVWPDPAKAVLSVREIILGSCGLVAPSEVQPE